MNAFEAATKFFEACDAPLGWDGCKQYVQEDAPFVAQSEPLAEIDSVEERDRHTLCLHPKDEQLG